MRWLQSMTDVPGSSANAVQQIAALRLAGVAHLDPLGLHHLEVLARRASVQQGRVKQLLDARLAQAAAAYALRQAEPAAATHQATPQPAGSRTPLGELADELTQHATSRASWASVGASAWQDGQGGLDSDWEATRYFRATWRRLSSSKRVAQAMGQLPKNAGPLNAHRLVLGSLALMREISPDYLSRFTGYVDTLMGLEPATPFKPPKPAVAKKSSAPGRGKKMKAPQAVK